MNISFTNFNYPYFILSIFFGVDSKYSETYFDMKISKSKIFYVIRFFLELSHFFKKGQKVKKRQSQKSLVYLFWSESTQNNSKPALSKNPRNRKFFPCKFFPWDSVTFFPNDQNSEKMTKSKILVVNVFGQNRFRKFRNAF